MEILIQRPGPFTIVQDLGRAGFRSQGVPRGGAADRFAHQLANLLVGNPPSAGTLEFTLTGPELVFSADCLIALTGAKIQGAASWRPLQVTAGQTVHLGSCTQGCRGYLAVSGGIDVPLLLGSASTYAPGHFGGFSGRALQAGDRVSVGPGHRRRILGHWNVDTRILPAYSDFPTLRMLPGAELDGFDQKEWTATFEVSPQSDRVGIRLRGYGLRRLPSRELLSTAVEPGTIQVPADGQPIILLADAQTLGGYPKLGHVISADLPLAAQLRPGDLVQFELTTEVEALRLFAERERSLAILSEGLAGKIQ